MIRSKRNFLTALLGTAAILPTCEIPTPANVYDHLKCCWSWYETKEILNGMPVRRDDISSRNDRSHTILSDSSSRDLIRLNSVAARIWELCDGRNSAEDMVLAIMRHYSVAPGVCANDVLVTLAALKRKSLISC